MRSGPLAGALFGLALVACGGRIDLTGAPGNTGDAGTVRDATASQQSPSMLDASNIGEAGGEAADGATCTIPPLGHGSGMCAPTQVFPIVSHMCGSTAYVMDCLEGAAPDPSLRCSGAVAVGAGGDYDYCCPCEGADAGTSCVNVDLSTYNRSCNSDKDCVAISSGSGITCCIGQCLTDAINVEAGALYWQTVGGLPSCGLSGCPAEHGPVCVLHVCTYE